MKYIRFGKDEVEGEEVFSVPEDSFSVSGSASGYELHWSVDGVNFAQYGDAVPANEPLRVVHSQRGAYFKLVGNTSTVTVLS